MKLFLRRQLRASGGSRAEAKELAVFAQQLGVATTPGLGKDAKAKIAADIGFGYHPYKQVFVRACEGLAVVLIIFVLVFAQSAKSGSALYSVKQGMTKVRNFVEHSIPFVDHPSEEPLHDVQENHGKGTAQPPATSGGNSGEGGTTTTEDSHSQGGSSGSGDSSGSSGESTPPSSSGSGTGSTDSGKSTSESSSGTSGSSGSDSGSGSNSGRDPNKPRD